MNLNQNVNRWMPIALAGAAVVIGTLLLPIGPGLWWMADGEDEVAPQRAPSSSKAVSVPRATPLSAPPSPTPLITQSSASPSPTPTPPSPASPSPQVTSPKASPVASAVVSQKPPVSKPATSGIVHISLADNGKTFSLVPGQVALLDGLPPNGVADLHVNITDPNVAIYRSRNGGNGVAPELALVAKAPGTTDVVVTFMHAGSSSGAVIGVAFTLKVTAA